MKQVTHKMKQFYPLNEKEMNTRKMSPAVHITVAKSNIECDMATKYSKICLSQRHLYHNRTKVEGKLRKQSLITQ